MLTRTGRGDGAGRRGGPPTVLALVLLLALVVATPAAAASVERAGGLGRIDTAIDLSVRAFPDGSADAIVVTRDDFFPDALAAAPLAAAAGAPVLLNPPGALHDDVRAEIVRLMGDPDGGTAYLMGGPQAQSETVEDQLEAMGLSVERIAHDTVRDRFGTAAVAARRAAGLWGGAAGDRVLVALGTDWADALAAGALAGHARWPILLVTPGEVPAVTNDTLRALGASHATVLGGPRAVPEPVKEQLAAGTRDRIGGGDRYDTSRLIAETAVSRGASRSTVVAATGLDFPDGLAAGPVAFALGGVSVLVGGEDLVDSLATKTWLETHRDTIGTVVVAGGDDAVSPETAGQIGFATTDVRLTTQTVATGFSAPVYVTSAPGDGRLFVVEQGGRIRTGDGATFLDISGRVLSGGERGLLGLAFHPGYADNGRYFVHYTRSGDGATVVEEYRRGSGSPVRSLLTVGQPAANHNGGQLEFGPDGMLYLGLGDGGGGDDQFRNAQDTGTLLGAIVRLHPDRTGGTNHMHGLRNPYRFSIDATDGLIYIGDVGQSAWEELDVVPYDAAGTDFGWPCREGAHDHRTGRAGCDGSYVEPVLEYPLNGTCAVTGGVVYRGSAIPALRGQYLYADYCAGWVRGFHFRRGIRSDERDWFDTGGNPAGFGFGPDGEVHIALRGGSIVKVVRAP